ncbi:MAG: sulfatase [Planctomycetota bacterium]|nr:sulfatase [Planctomycetota bacterium]
MRTPLLPLFAVPVLRVPLLRQFVICLLATNSAQAVEVTSPTVTPNIILIVADDLGYSDLGCYGAKQIRTPVLDKLAQDGTRFTDFSVAQAVCTASRAALLSGCYPNRIGMAGALNHTSSTGIHPDEVLLPELCKSRGYATACFGKWHLGTRRQFDPNHNGFDRWFGLPYSNDNGPLHPSVRGIPSLPLIEDGTTVALDPDQSTFSRIFTEKAIEFIVANKLNPFFLYIPHVMPHVPIAASKKFLGSSTSGLYGDVVQEEDYYIGEILKALDANGLANNTLVLFLSDNGPFLSYGSHAGSAGPLREGKLTTFEGGVRVPLIARWPGHVPAGRVCDEMITGIDLLPTIAKIINEPLSGQKIDGQDLSPLLLNTPDAKGRDTFAYYSGTELHAIRQGKWKLHVPHDFITVNGATRTDGKPANYENMAPVAIEESGVRGIASRHGYKVEALELSLFDLASDPGEKQNVASEHPQIVAKLQSIASGFRKELGDSITKQIGTGIRPVGRE